MYGYNAQGSNYLLFLIAAGKLEVCRNVSGNTGALVGGTSVTVFFFGSYWWAANSLSMS